MCICKLEPRRFLRRARDVDCGVAEGVEDRDDTEDGEDGIFSCSFFSLLVSAFSIVKSIFEASIFVYLLKNEKNEKNRNNEKNVIRET